MNEPVAASAADPAVERSEAPELLVERAGAVMTIVLNRPHRKNALTFGMISTITASVRAASMDDETRVVVIRANGDDFCSGIDLVESNGGRGSDAPPAKPRTGHLQRGLAGNSHEMIRTLWSAQVPIVSAVRGWAVGIGNMLSLSADVVIADSSARFWVPFVTKGFTPDSGSTWLLTRLVGLARAKQMVLRGQPLDGARAAEWGLISECVAEGELDAAVGVVTAELAAGATTSIGLARALLHQNLSVTLSAALENEAIHEELAVRSDDFKEGMRAFAQKRQPEYTGW